MRGTSRARSATASSTTRRPSIGATTPSRCRPGTTWSSTRCTSARSRPPDDRHGHVRRCPPPAALPRAAGRLGGPGHAPVRVRRRHLVGLQPGPPVRHRIGLWRARTRSSASSARRTRHGIAVIVDVVYNHLGPSDLDLWRFDGWAEGEWGGIYFYNDERAVTPWGATRPDYGRGEVRTFLRDSAMTWLEEFRCDGLRFDCHGAHPDRRGLPGQTRLGALPDGWSFLAWINDEIRARQPWKITIAEDLEDDPILVDPDRRGRGRLRGPVGRRVHPPRPARARGRRRCGPRHRRGRRRHRRARAAATR